MLKTLAATALVAAIAGAACGAIAMAKWDARQVARLTGDLSAARRTAVSEHAAREAVQQHCAAADAAASRAADLAETARRAIERANQELDDAILNGAAGDDGDPLRAQLERLRGSGPAAGGGGDPAASARGADPLPRGP